MKKLKILSLLLAALLLLSLCACQKAETPEAPDTPDTPPDVSAPDTADDVPADDVPATSAPEEDEEPAAPDTDADAETPAEAETEAPVVEPFVGRWANRAERTDDTVIIDQKGVIIELKAQTALKNIQIERVAQLIACGDDYDSSYKSYEVSEVLYTLDEIAEDETIELQLDVPLSDPTYAVSWEDEFGERERRLMLTSKFYDEGKPDEWLALINFREKIRPIEITAGLDLAAVGEAALTETDNYGGETAWGTEAVQTRLVTQYNFDIDGNGRKNSIELLQIRDKFDQFFYTVRVVCGNVFYDADVTFPSVSSLWMADLDADGCAEIYISGDMASDDYMTYGWTLGENGLQSVFFCGNIRSGEYEKAAPCIDGEILTIANQAMHLESYVHRLGSHYVTQDYTAEADGTLTPMPNQDWTCDDGRMVTVTKELPVTSGGKKTTLPVGTQLTVTAVNAGTRAYFRTESGMTGFVTLEEGEYFGAWNIDGISDTEYFDNLIYAG